MHRSSRHGQAPLWLRAGAALVAIAPAALAAQSTAGAPDEPAQGLGDKAASAVANEWTRGLTGTATVGAGVRVGRQNAKLVPGGSNNFDDGDLNYGRGDLFSGIAKVYVKADFAHRSKLGVAISGVAWDDVVQRRHDVAHGNNPNDYVPDVPLSDHGFAHGARFRGALLLDAYAHGTNLVLGGDLQWRIGRLSLERERLLTIAGPRQELDTRNFAAGFAPGALDEEGVVPFHGARLRWNATPALRLDAFWQFAQAKAIEPGCGTYFQFSDYTASGCNRLFYSAVLTEQQNIAAGIFAPRSADIHPPDRPDQFGVGAAYTVGEIGTRFSAEYAHYHSRIGVASAVKGLGIGPNVGSTYAVDYGGNKNLFSVGTATFIPDLRLVWVNEASMTSNEPVALNGDDLLLAFLAGRGPLGPDAIAAPPHSVYHGYDRYSVYQLGSGAKGELAGVLGASASSLGIEVGWKSVPGLADVSVRRYGRPSLAYVCPVPASCATNDGYVTRNAWSYRIRAGLDYATSNGVRWKPSLAFAHDVHGWSYDYRLVQGRKTVQLALDAELGPHVFANLTYVASRGGQFNTRKDLDYVLASAGARF